MELSPDQKICFDSIMDWHHDPSTVLTLGGYAGCGKTTLLSRIRAELSDDIRVAFCCFTGKAASVLRSKLEMVGSRRFPGDYCGTIHSLIYQPKINKSGDITGWVLCNSLDYDLIIIDEASMVSEDLFRDLQSYGIPILATGDHGQLPPITGKLNLMQHPQLKLEKIHRFAEQDALIQISVLAREQGYIPYGTYGEGVYKVHKNHSMITQFINNCDNFMNTSILCGFNKTRIDLNKKIRARLGYDTKYPKIGERLICLKNNKDAKHCPIYNGILGTLRESCEHGAYLEIVADIDNENKQYRGEISPLVFNNPKPPSGDYIYKQEDELFLPNSNKKKKAKRKHYLDYFDYGYVLTVHKSQGSEWDNVMVIEQPCSYWSGDDWNRWLYTAVTRSKKSLLIVR